jgi:hypothetical protein
MNFREFVKMYEAGGLFQNPGQPEVPDVYRGTSTNKDLYLHKYLGTGGPVAQSKGASPALFTGSGPALGNQQVKRMPKK